MKTTIVAATVGLLLASSAVATAQTATEISAISEKEVQVSIAALPLADALQEFGRQAGLSVVMSAEVARGLVSNAVAGKLTTRAALDALLLGSGLQFQFLDAHTVAIRLASDQVSAKAAASQRTAALSDAPRGTASHEIESGTGTGTKDAGDPSSKENQAIWLEEVRVVGTWIRDVAPPGSQILRLSRVDIDQTGLPTVPDVLRTLTQSFGGGVTEGTVGPAGAGDREAESNNTRGTAFNLRGLGAGSTLVLVNGRRIAPTGTEGAYTDLSGLALTAVDHIDVLPDGASALYGSDAVGGVVNIVTRQDYDGAETQARYGSVTSGGAAEYQLAQTFGASWDAGNALVSLEYYHRDALPANARAQMDSDLRRFGGSNFDWNFCNPGTISAGGRSFAIPSGQDGSALTPADFSGGTQNLCSRNEGSDLLAESKRWNALGTVRQQVSDRFTVFADAAFSGREVTVDTANITALFVPETNAFYTNPTGGTGPLIVFYDGTDDLGPNHVVNDIRTSSIGLGSTFKFMSGWQAMAQLSYASDRQAQRQIGNFDFSLMNSALASSDPAVAFNPFGDGSHTSASTLALLAGSSWSTFDVESELQMATLTVDGPLLNVPAGAVKLAVGGEFRKHAFDSTLKAFQRSVTEATSTRSASLDRRVTAGFAELYVPVVGASNRRPAIHELSFSLAGRYEHYDDFGSATVPRFGVTWAPVSRVAVRGTWGKSYKAPNLSDLVEANNSQTILSYPDTSSPTGQSVIMLWGGKNKDLREETATTWTAGLDFKPEGLEGFSMGLTYFDIDFRNRISGTPNQNFLSDPINSFAVNRHPTDAERQEACSRGTFQRNTSPNPGTCLTADIDALVDARLLNVAVMSERGMDVTMTLPRKTSVGDLSAALSATYLFEYATAFKDSASVEDLLNRPTYPIDLKVRGSLAWSLRGYSATAFLNYIDSYSDNVNRPGRHVSSWTTVDLNLTYRFQPEGESIFNGSQFSLAAQNVFDKDPPFYNNSLGIGYDQANGDLLGRFVSFNVRKGW